MASLMLADEPRYEEMQKVVELYVQNVNPTEIARRTGIRRADVILHIEEYRKSAVNLEVMKDRVEELILSMDNHYSQLIQKAYEVIEEVDNKNSDGKETMTRSQMLSQKMNAIKTIADLEQKRIDMLQKSGLLEAADVGDQLVEMEQQYNELIELLENELCDKCLPHIINKLRDDADDASRVTVVYNG